MWRFSDPHREQQYVQYKCIQTVINEYLCTFCTLSAVLLLLVRLASGGDVRATLSYLVLYMIAKLMPLMLGKTDFFIGNVVAISFCETEVVTRGCFCCVVGLQWGLSLADAGSNRRSPTEAG
jgi:hypothetical protein